jgi:DNA-binding SARP family transcriptional activator
MTARPHRGQVGRVDVDATPVPVLLEVRVLRPTPDVRAAGDHVRLPPIESLLLLFLAVAHPAPMHVETLHEALWPGQPLNRPRLNTLVHRIRCRLGPAGAALRRSRDLLGLDPQLGCTDLDAYRRALTGPPEVRARAVSSVAGNLGHAAHPFEDRLIEARERFVEEWLARAQDLLRAGAIDLHHLAPALAALDVHPRTLTAP